MPSSQTDTPPRRFAPDEVFTIEDVAEIFKVSTRQVMRWVYEQGSLKYVVMPGGRGRRILGKHINAALEAGERQALADREAKNAKARKAAPKARRASGKVTRRAGRG
jgi:Helix-turn-helix domain